MLRMVKSRIMCFCFLKVGPRTDDTNHEWMGTLDCFKNPTDALRQPSVRPKRFGFHGFLNSLSVRVLYIVSLN
jgi:hypothetical protein